MLQQFNRYITEKGLIKEGEKILLAVSGGIDSCVMADLFIKSGYTISIAHCNFKLRGKESDEDHLFVQMLAKEHNLEFYHTEFETKVHSEKEGISIQMAARNLRYNWFQEILISNKIEKISIAHNRDDVGETMLLNLVRGTGLNGLTGIKPIQGNIIRPLLFAHRSQIEEYAIKEKIVYREDSSNKETKYYRNLIRKDIIPRLEKINPSIRETLNLEAEIFSSTYILYQKELEHIREAITIENSEVQVFSIPKILALRLTPPILFDLFSIYGFTYSDAHDIDRSLESEPGRIFYSSMYVMIKDRNTLIIKNKEKNEPEADYTVTEAIGSINSPIKLNFEIIERGTDFVIPKSKKVVAFDADKLTFPLIIRRWKEGDYFVPLGMRGRKKLSDYFIDQKINLLEKKNLWLLTSEERIVWIIGYQIDDRVKIVKDTKNILLVTLNR